MPLGAAVAAYRPEMVFLGREKRCAALRKMSRSGQGFGKKHCIPLLHGHPHDGEG